MATIQQVPVSSIYRGDNDRKRFDPVALQTLADSIATAGQGVPGEGLLQAIVLRPMADGQYEIVAGERRFRACTQLLGWATVPAIVKQLTDRQAREAMATENLGRVDLDPMEEAQCYARLQSLDGHSPKEIAKAVGRTEQRVKDRLDLLHLCPEAQDMVAKGQLGLKYAAVLAQRTEKDGPVALDFNFQMQALRLFNLNKAPTVEWWQSTITELIGQCRQNSLFDMADFMTAKAEELQQAAEQPLPLPGDDVTAYIAGDTPQAVMAAQIRFWQATGEAWKRRGNKPAARQCHALAKGFALANAALVAMQQAAAVSVAQPVVDPPMAPPVADPSLLSVPLTGRVGRRLCKCGRRATHSVGYPQALDGQHRRLVTEDCCNTCLERMGGVPQIAQPAQQLAFGVAA